MMRSLALSLVMTLSVAVPAFAAETTATPGLGPQELMEQVSHELLREIDANRDALAKDPARVRAVIDQYLLPHFDTDYAARLVLGKHWRTATAEQRTRFIETFYKEDGCSRRSPTRRPTRWSGHRCCRSRWCRC